MLNGLLLFGAEALRRRAPETTEDDDARIATQVGFREAFLVGAAQALALIPGFSRSGATMGAARQQAPSLRAKRHLHSDRHARRETCGDPEALVDKCAGMGDARIAYPGSSARGVMPAV
jgi:hypothetical protein